MYSPLRNEDICYRKICVHMFIKVLFIITKNGNNPNVHQLKYSLLFVLTIVIKP